MRLGKERPSVPRRVSPPFSRVFVAKSRRRRQSHGVRPEGTGGVLDGTSRSPTALDPALPAPGNRLRTRRYAPGARNAP